jgi:hypothetical protein
LNGLGKGVLKEAFQVFIQELNESELSDEVSKLIKAVSGTGGT